MARNGQYFKIEYDLASYYGSFGKERDTLTRFPTAMDYSARVSLIRNYFYPKADLIFQVEMDQKEDHFHIVLLTTPFSYPTDVSDG